MKAVKIQSSEFSADDVTGTFLLRLVFRLRCFVGDFVSTSITDFGDDPILIVFSEACNEFCRKLLEDVTRKGVEYCHDVEGRTGNSGEAWDDVDLEDMEDSDDVNVRGCLDVLLDMLRVPLVLLKGSASSRPFLLEMIGVPPLGANGVKALMPHQLFVWTMIAVYFESKAV